MSKRPENKPEEIIQEQLEDVTGGSCIFDIPRFRSDGVPIDDRTQFCSDTASVVKAP